MRRGELRAHDRILPSNVFTPYYITWASVRKRKSDRVLFGVNLEIPPFLKYLKAYSNVNIFRNSDIS